MQLFKPLIVLWESLEPLETLEALEVFNLKFTPVQQF